MKLTLLLSRLGLTLSLCCMVNTAALAGAPLWSFSPNTSPQVTINANATAAIVLLFAM